MKKYLILLVFCGLYFNSCFSQQRVRINAIQVDNSFDSLSLLKLQKAVKMLDSIFNSEEFARKVLHTDFKVGNCGLENYEILELIKSGQDSIKGKPKDYSIDLRIQVFDSYLGNGNFGVTDMDSKITTTHRCYILQNDVKCYASHLAHEYMHQIGFYDKRRWGVGTKTFSVPYEIGDIVDEMLGNTNPCQAIDKTCPK